MHVHTLYDNCDISVPGKIFTRFLEDSLLNLRPAALQFDTPMTYLVLTTGPRNSALLENNVVRMYTAFKLSPLSYCAQNKHLVHNKKQNSTAAAEATATAADPKIHGHISFIMNHIFVMKLRILRN